MKIALWIVQALLALMFIFFGIMKMTGPYEELVQTLTWAEGKEGMMRFIGIMELLGGIGVILPGVLRIKPQLVSLAALGLATIMALAVVTHLLRGEYPIIGTNVTLMSLALFVAWGRWKKYPIIAR